MGGILYFDNPRPLVGAKVIIIVDRVNTPSGIWDGELISIAADDHEVLQHRYYLPRTRRALCTTRITDPRTPHGLVGCEPDVDYSVYPATSGAHYFRERLNNANTEISGLKRRMEIERNSWHAMMKALVNPEAFSRLQKLLEEFLARLDH